jgi:hypothetical protein
MADQKKGAPGAPGPSPAAPVKPDKPDKPAESRDVKFKRLGNRRIPPILKAIHNVGNLSARSQYSYTQEQVDKMFGLLHEALRTARARFEGAKTTVQTSIF